jgi:hypothetical protein
VARIDLTDGGFMEGSMQITGVGGSLTHEVLTAAGDQQLIPPPPASVSVEIDCGLGLGFLIDHH